MTIRSKSKRHDLFSIFDVVFLFILAVSLTVLTCSCSAADTQSTSSSTTASDMSTTTDASAPVEQNDITIKVTSPEGPNAIDVAQELSVAKDATVLEALRATELDITVVDGPYGAYVEAIGNIANEGTSGWTYTVNGEQIPISAGEAIVNAGDSVEWTYIDLSA